jgi:hypothetical protein
VRDTNGGRDTGNSFAPKSGALLRVPKTGGAPSDFHVPAAADRAIGDFYADGTDVWFIEGPTAMRSQSGIFRRGAADAMATPLGTTRYDGLTAYVAGVDANSVYAITPGMSGSVDAVRIDRASGTETVIASDVSSVGAWTYDGFLWFYSASGGGYFKAPLSASGASPTKVTDINCLSGLLLSPDGFFCGGPLTIQRYADETFSAPTRIFDILDTKLEGNGPRPHAVAGANVIVSLRINPKKRTPLLLVPKTGGAWRPLACDVASVEHLVTDGAFAYWLERRADGDGMERMALFRTPIP